MKKKQKTDPHPFTHERNELDECLSIDSKIHLLFFSFSPECGEGMHLLSTHTLTKENNTADSINDNFDFSFFFLDSKLCPTRSFCWSVGRFGPSVWGTVRKTCHDATLWRAPTFTKSDHFQHWSLLTIVIA